MSIVDIRAALETALDNMPGLIPSVGIVSSTAGASAVLQTDAPHQLKTGLEVGISGHTGSTPDLNGTYKVVANTANTFSLQHKVTGTPIASAAPGVGGVISAKLTAWEGTHFKPHAGVPTQRVHFIFSEPFNPSYGDGSSVLTRESGFMQVTLFYPNGFGTRDVMSRAQLIKSTFPRGSSFSSNGTIVHIDGTPEMMNGVPVEEHFAVPVRIPFWADVYTTI